jgi:MSHA pilin protein MshA
MVTNEKGFTLIELIIVIVILGILAVVAVPKYQDLRSDAAEAAADGVYGAATGACAINFASRLISPTRATMIDSITALAIAMGTLPEGWTASDATHMDDGDGREITLTAVTPATQSATPTSPASVAKDW